MHLSAEHLHSIHVQFLSVHVLGPHVDLRAQSQSRARHSGSNPMLSRAGFSNDPPFPHFLGQESLAESIVDLVGATMQEILSLQIDPSPSNMASQIGSKIHRCWSSSEIV